MAVARRRFRIAVGVLVAIAGFALVLQYTEHARFAPRRTDALWGAVVGMVGFGLILDRWYFRSRGRATD